LPARVSQLFRIGSSVHLPSPLLVDHDSWSRT
jgi:hypothetical protein